MTWSCHIICGDLILLHVAPHQRPATCMRAPRLRVLRWAYPFRLSRSQQSSKIPGLGDCPFRPHVLISAARALHRAPSSIRSFSSTRHRLFMLDADSTIYALSTAPGRAAIAVVRVSGPACASVRIPFQCRFAFSAVYTNSTLPLDIPSLMPQ